MIRVYIGLGSNLDHPHTQLRRALDALSVLPHTQLVAVSPIYQSAPVGPAGQPDYLNAVAALDTTLSPLQLLDALQHIETEQGRIRKERWGARTLDLDILLFGELHLTSDRLTIPHPYLKERSFVLYPLADINPGLRLPDGQLLQDLVTLCPFIGLTKLGNLEDL